MKTQLDPENQALNVPQINVAPGPEYGDAVRRWQGIPGIERAENGRLWALWYSGGAGEGNDNYVILVTSDDDGLTWSEPKLVIDPPGMVRAYDACCWIDPLGRLWLFWAQSYTWFDGRCGVWAIHTENPDAESPQWSTPRRLCDGIMMNKPVVLSTGEWLLPAAVWDHDPKRVEFETQRFSNVIVSTDQGKNWQLRGSADIPERTYDEHQLVELKDGRLWMLVRTKYGIGESFSEDQGRTWSPGQPSKIAGPGSRFFMRRLQSGRLLLINHFDFDGRNNLTASLSEDDGNSWPFQLLLDGRLNVSYPDATESPEGLIYAIYDRERYIDREILMAVFSEDDIMNGPASGDVCRLRMRVNQAKGERVILKKQEKTMFNGGLVSISFRKLTPAEIVKLVVKSGLKCIEWGGDVHVPHGNKAVAREVSRMTTEAGLSVASYGSYYRVAASEDEGLSFEKVLDSAKALNAPIIRVWAGNLGSAEADEDYRKHVVDESARIAELAQAADIKVAYEYHGNTLTDTNESAQALLKAVDHPNMYTYWQPPNKRSVEYCLEGLQAVLPQVVGLHVFSWIFNENDRSQLPLADGWDWWEKYLTVAAKIPGEIPALLEFVKGDEPEQFLEDAATLKKWLERVQA